MCDGRNRRIGENFYIISGGILEFFREFCNNLFLENVIFALPFKSLLFRWSSLCEKFLFIYWPIVGCLFIVNYS